jgi:hypothetical protein
MKFLEYLNESSSIPKILLPLAAEAKKYKTFAEFEYAFLHDIKHGRYYHVTDNPDFTIDSTKGPRDMSSMAIGHGMDVGALMITSDLEAWMSSYSNRKYIAVIDMSAVSPDKYKQVNRGFGNEFYVTDPSSAKVIKVLSRSAAASDSRRYQSALESYIRGSNDLKHFYNLARGNR